MGQTAAKDDRQQLSTPLFAEATGQLTSYAAPKIDRQKAEQLSTLLRRLAIPYYRPDFTEQQATALIADYILDLAEFAICDVEEAARVYRKDPKSEFFPKPGVLCKLASDARKERNARSDRKPMKLEFGEARPLMWWTQPVQLWRSNWRESETPLGAMVKDTVGGRLRLPERVVL
jgi:hypothetical protein